MRAVRCWWLLVFVFSCGVSTKTLDLTVTLPDHTAKRHSFSQETGFFFEGQGRATASFPNIAEWGVKVPVGLALRVAPLQPGRYGTGGNLHLGEDSVAKSKTLSIDLTVERVAWQNNGAHPFRIDGTFTGTSTEDHRVEGRFSTTTDDCADKVGANAGSFLCGAQFPSKQGTEQRWSIDSWVTEGTCPDAVFRRFAGGMTFSLDKRFASAGGERRLECVVTDTAGPKVVCGANEENVSADGCTWAITAFAVPGTSAAGAPKMTILAGTTGSSCAPKLCAMSPRSFVHVSGATGND